MTVEIHSYYKLVLKFNDFTLKRNKEVANKIGNVLIIQNHNIQILTSYITTNYTANRRPSVTYQ